MALDLVAPVAGLPVGPVTEDRVRKQLTLDDADHQFDLALEAAINAVNIKIVGWPCCEDFLASLPADPDDRAGITWPWPLIQGGVLLATKIFSRRNSIEGVATFGVEGIAYVQRLDPDVALLLNLGQHRKPKVG
jgi:hypothetical protein